MSPSHVGPVLGLDIHSYTGLADGISIFKSVPLPWLVGFNNLDKSVPHYAGWGYLNILISDTSLAGGI